MKKILKRAIGSVIASALILSSVAFTGFTSVSAADNYIAEQGGWFESAYVEWNSVPDATGFAAYVKGAAEADSAYVQLDDELIRKYPTYFRADAVGLKAGQYVIKVVPYINGVLDESKAFVSDAIDVIEHDRSGFAFDAKSPNKTASGGYNDDGTPASGAKIIYITEDTKDSVTLDVVVNSNGTVQTGTGFAEIMSLRQKGYDKTPLIIRMIGKVTPPSGVNSSGYIQVKGCYNVTVEGIGEDATCVDWSYLVRDANNVEIRNFGFMNFQDDGVSVDTDNYNIWIHNCDFFYGKQGSGDKIKGDGSTDTKGFDYVTVSYNHYWDSGKCNLCGMGESAGHITYHHNWYDYSDSRHPRIRQHTVHSYNNFFDGNSKYGVGATTGSSAYVENNYFRNCKHPMLISMQGSDLMDSTGYDNDNATFSKEAGGMIKAYNNIIEGASNIELGTGTEPIYYGSSSTSDSATQFDAYLASSRDEKVPSTVTALSGGSTYNNFDTASDMYSYKLDNPEDVPAIVSAYAGRVNGSDFFEATGTSRSDFKALTDVSYDGSDHVIDSEFKAVILAYEPLLVSIGGKDAGGTVASTESSSTTTETTTETTTVTTTETTTETTTIDEPNPPTPTDVYGDADGNGTVDANDVALVVQHILKGTALNNDTKFVDVNNDGKIDTSDAAMILQNVLDKSYSLPR